MKKYSLLILISLLLVLIGGFKLNEYSQSDSSLVSTKQIAAEPEVQPYNHDCPAGKTAFQALTDMTPRVAYSESPTGVDVAAINDVAQGEGKEWKYSVNGHMSPVSADTYFCEGGEQITWELI